MIKIKISNSDILVLFNGSVEFDTDFLIQITRIFPLLNHEGRLLLRYDRSAKLDKMVLAYIYNICTFIKNKYAIPIFLSKDFYYELMGTVTSHTGEEYRQIEFKDNKIPKNKDIEHYRLQGDEQFNKVVDDLITLITKTNMIYNLDKVQLFLKTTIGEIFSNAFIHNDINEYYYFKYISDNLDNSKYLFVNIIDYGNTIPKNVQHFLDDKIIKEKTYIEWATKNGNTTRLGSGGYGLPTLLSYIREANGNLTILSGNELFSMESGIIHYNSQIEGVFPGTAICFKVKLYDFENFFDYNESENIISTRRISLNDL